MKIAGLYLAMAAALVSGGAAGDDGLRALCPDRPGKNTSACTVDAGYVQLESDIFNGSFQHRDGVTTDIWFVTDPLLKYGVADDLDVEASLAPLVLVRTHDSRTGATQTLGGVGDLFLRGKWAAIGNGGSDFAVVLEPFLKLPTARTGIGNGAVEGGLVVPVSLALSSEWSLGSTPELDLLKDGSGNGRHANLIEVIGINRNLTSAVTLGAEMWEDTEFDPAGTIQSWSFDVVGSWQTGAETQLDAGINLGLNRNTPGVQIYTGVSHRF